MARGPGSLSTTRWRRPVLGLAAIAIITVVAYLVFAPQQSEAERVLGRAANAREPERYAFEYRPQAVGLQSCFAGRRALSGLVDQRNGVAWLIAGGITIGIIRSGEALVHRDALPGWPVTSGWSRVTPPVSTRMREALTTTLGVDAAGYLLRHDLPDSGAAIARAAMETFRDVRLVARSPGAAVIDAAIDPTTLAAKSGQPETAYRRPLVLRLTVTDDGAVQSVVARLDAVSPIDGEEPFGYMLTFSDAGPMSPEPFEAAALTDAAIPVQPKGLDTECRVGS